jgi:ubiquinone/menaquinone biosynthesis C-methylase UbiE
MKKDTDYEIHADFWKREKPKMQSDFLCRPFAVRLLGNVKGKKIIDAGCGEGYLSRKLSQQGAKVTGVDNSKNMIMLANQQAGGPSYFIDNVVTLKSIPDSSQEMYLSSLVFSCLEKDSELSRALKSAHRVLKKKGVLVVAFPHPFEAVDYYKSGWVSFLEKPRNYFIKHDILKKLHDSQGNSFLVKNTHRSLGQLINEVISAGFTIEKVAEPEVTKKDIKLFSKIWGEELTKPAYLIIKARK